MRSSTRMDFYFGKECKFVMRLLRFIKVNYMIQWGGERLLGWLSRAFLFLVGFPHSLLCWEPGGQLVMQHSLGSDSWILVPLQRLMEHRKLMYKELHALEQGFLLQLREGSELDPEGQ